MFNFGNFKSSSGLILSWKIECDHLVAEDWECFARIVRDHVGRFGKVEGVPRGGLPFADALQPYATKGPLLIVDDVLTTGASMEAHRKGRLALGFVLFSRGVTPGWVQPIFRTTL